MTIKEKLRTAREPIRRPGIVVRAPPRRRALRTNERDNLPVDSELVDVVPGGLVLVRIDRERDAGEYVEPACRVHHRVPRRSIAQELLG